MASSLNIVLEGGCREDMKSFLVVKVYRPVNASLARLKIVDENGTLLLSKDVDITSIPENSYGYVSVELGGNDCRSLESIAVVSEDLSFYRGSLVDEKSGSSPSTSLYCLEVVADKTPFVGLVELSVVPPSGSSLQLLLCYERSAEYVCANLGSIGSSTTLSSPLALYDGKMVRACIEGAQNASLDIKLFAASSSYPTTSKTISLVLEYYDSNGNLVARRNYTNVGAYIVIAIAKPMEAYILTFAFIR